MNLTGRTVEMFRCYRPPLIGPRHDLAYMVEAKGLYAELTDIGIYVREIGSGREHIVPYANIESMKLIRLTEDGKETVDEVKPKRGRPSEK